MTSPELLQVVPWRYGYAHTWALRWLMQQPQLLSLVLGAIPGLDLPAPLRLEGPIVTEKALKPARADLVATVRDAAGQRHRLAIETKVDDAIRAEQLSAYAALGYQPVLYLPGLTGLSAEGVSTPGVLRLTGSGLAVALAGIQLPPLIGSYVGAVCAENERMQVARSAERTGEEIKLPPGKTGDRALKDVAWLIEVRAALIADGVQANAMRMRVERHDRGIFWGGSWRELAPDGAGAFVEITAAVQADHRVVAIKVGGGSPTGRGFVFDRLAAGVLSDAHSWRRGARRLTRETTTIWALDAAGLIPAGVSACARTAADLVSSVAARPAGS